MEENISLINSRRLADVSAHFCAINNIEVTPEIGQALADAVVAACAKWYKENGQPDFDPTKVIICDDAIIYAFERMQMIAMLADISAMLGVGVGDLSGMPN